MFAYKKIGNMFLVYGENVRFFVETEAEAITQVNTRNKEYLEKQKAAKIKLLHDKYQSVYQEYLNQYPKNEVDSFGDKRREALAWTADNTVATPIIDSIVAGWGGNKADYVASVIAKVQYLAQKEGEMVKTRDAIKACTTQAELDAIVV